MGLDVGFYIAGEDESIVYLQGHYEFFYMFGQQPCRLVDDVSSDFWIDSETLKGVEQLVLMLEPSVGVARSLSDDDICLIMSAGEDDFSWAILKRAYLQILGKLRAAIDENGPLVCSWSA